MLSSRMAHSGGLLLSERVVHFMALTLSRMMIHFRSMILSKGLIHSRPLMRSEILACSRSMLLSNHHDSLCVHVAFVPHDCGRNRRRVPRKPFDVGTRRLRRSRARTPPALGYAVRTNDTAIPSPPPTYSSTHAEIEIAHRLNQCRPVRIIVLLRFYNPTRTDAHTKWRDARP